MSRVTYHEFRPGHWVKLVDGKIVGRATAEEVAAWKREKAEQSAIWQDVVQRATSVEPKPEILPETPLSEAKKVSTEPVTIWQDILSQVSAIEPRTEHPPRVAKGKEKAERMPEKDESEPMATHVISPRPVAKARPKDVVKPVSTEQVAQIEPAPAAKAAPAEAKAVKPAAKSRPRVEKEATPARKTKAGLVLEEKAEAAAETSRSEAQPVSPQLPRKARANRTHKAATAKQQVPLEEEVPPEVEEPEVEVAPQPISVTATRRTATKTSPIASQERLSQVYLWIMAGASDDPIATVRSGLARYQERFHQPAEVVLCHIDDMAILEKANLPVDVRQGKGV
ncbi:MAG: hypothetical protein H5T63_04305, partial [Chloroflexi bacterium]|nr:hypothetical protein [Chloroflexota bacterium]